MVLNVLKNKHIDIKCNSLKKYQNVINKMKLIEIN